MNMYKAIGLIILSIFLIELSSEALIVNYGNNDYPYRRVSTTSSNNLYNKDLTRVERFLFGKTYTSENNNTRLSRIEKKLFNKNYPSMNTAQRMNNILANCRGEEQYYGNTAGSYYRPKNTVRNRIMNTIIGQPTGFTPEITNSPYINKFGPSYNRGFYGNNGWGYHNVYNPTVTGAGIHILD